MIELPQQDPCAFCESLAERGTRWAVVDDCERTITVMNPFQFEEGQVCVITKRHVGTLLDLDRDEGTAVIAAAKKVAQALVAAYRPLGVLTFQNNGVYSGQEVPHYHYHVVPRQPGSEWGIGPPQLAVFENAGRVPGTPHDPSGDAERRERVQVAESVLHERAAFLREHLPN
ncbi:MAG: HIT family protein [Pseudomonadota bacterium]